MANIIHITTIWSSIEVIEVFFFRFLARDISTHFCFVTLMFVWTVQVPNRQAVQQFLENVHLMDRKSLVETDLPKKVAMMTMRFPLPPKQGFVPVRSSWSVGPDWATRES